MIVTATSIAALVAGSAVFASHASLGDPELAVSNELDRVFGLAARDDKCEDILVFDPPTLTILDTNFQDTFTVKLKSAPKGSVEVRLDGKGIMFDNHSAWFGPGNWSQPVAISVTPTAEFKASDKYKSVDVSITADVNAPCEEYNTCKQTYSGKRTIFPGGTCTVSGDPHYVTFDNLKFTNNEAGNFYMIDSEYISVQVYQFPCTVWRGIKASCVGAVGIAVGNSAGILSIADADYDNVNWANKGNKPRFERISNDVDAIEYSQEGDVYTFTLPCGSEIAVTWAHTNGGFNNNDPDKFHYLNVNVHLDAGYSKKIGGLCNQFENDNNILHGMNVADKYKCDKNSKGNCKNIGELNKFFKAWEVKKEDSLFEGKFKNRKHPYNKGGNDQSTGYKRQNGLHHNTYGTTCSPSTSTAVPPQTSTSRAAPSDTTSKSTSSSSSKASPSSSSSQAAPSTSSSSSQAAPSTSSSQAAPSTSSSQAAPSNTYYVPLYIPPVTTSTSSSQAAPSTSSSQAAPSSSPSYAAYVPPGYYAPTEDAVTNANAICSDILSVPGCDELCPEQKASAIEDCVADVLTSNSYIFCEGHKQSYKAFCASQTGYLAQSQDTANQEKAQQIQQQAGFGANQCTNSCSGHGTCNKFGCQCDNGWTHHDCSISTSTFKLPSPEKIILANSAQNAVNVSSGNDSVIYTYNASIKKSFGVWYTLAAVGVAAIVLC